MQNDLISNHFVRFSKSTDAQPKPMPDALLFLHAICTFFYSQRLPLPAARRSSKSLSSAGCWLLTARAKHMQLRVLQQHNGLAIGNLALGHHH